jgi:hypothetical protein
MFRDIQRRYTRLVGIYCLTVGLLLFWDLLFYGHRPEMWHRLFHLGIATIVIWNWNKNIFWKQFSLYNGILFLFLAAFGFAFPDFGSNGGLMAFGSFFTFMNFVIGAAGVGAYFTDRIRV